MYCYKQNEGYELKKMTTMIKEDTTGMADGEEKRVRRWLRVSVVVDASASGGVKRFRKFFWIPDGVVSDEIKTKFSEEESVLRIFMPKSVKGVSGVGVEEVKEEEMGSGRDGKTAPAPDKVAEEVREASGETIQGKEEGNLEGYIGHAPLIIPEQEHDRMESLKLHHSEEVEVIETNDGGKGGSKLKLMRPCLFAGSAILLSLLLVIRF